MYVIGCVYMFLYIVYTSILHNLIIQYKHYILYIPRSLQQQVFLQPNHLVLKVADAQTGILS